MSLVTRKLQFVIASCGVSYSLGGQTVVQARYRPTIVGQERIHIHVIDTDTKELVSFLAINWQLFSACH
jgi:hypothetical protein